MAALLVSGCAHTDYLWLRTRLPAPQPWFYVSVADVDRTCREIGAQAAVGNRINGCAVWEPTHCTIYLPLNAPSWIIDHEERHCNGEEH